MNTAVSDARFFGSVLLQVLDMENCCFTSISQMPHIAKLFNSSLIELLGKQLTGPGSKRNDGSSGRYSSSTASGVSTVRRQVNLQYLTWRPVSSCQGASEPAVLTSEISQQLSGGKCTCSLLLGDQSADVRGQANLQ